MNNIMELAMKLIAQNPNIMNNPTAKSALEAIQNGDNIRGEQIANNLLNSYGMNKEQAIQQAKRYFGL